MNQIICNTTINLDTSIKDFKKRNFFKLLFIILVILSIFLLIYYIFFRYDLYKYEKISQKMLDNYSITTLYSDSNNYTASKLNNKQLPSNISSSSVIGIIEIKKLNITYPIISEMNKEYLKISPCKFYGSNPNEIRKSLYCCS